MDGSINNAADQSCGDAFTADITDHNGRASTIGFEDIADVTADLVGWNTVQRHLHVRHQPRPGKERGLNGSRPFQFLFELAQPVLFGPHKCSRSLIDSKDVKPL